MRTKSTFSSGLHDCVGRFRSMGMAACLALGFVCLFPGRIDAEIIDRVLAVVGGNLITLTDISAAIDLGLVSVPAGTADPIRAVLDELIDRELLLAEVERYAPPEPTAQAVDREVSAMRARLSTTSNFAATLERSGIDESHVREMVRESLRIQAYLDQRFTVAPPTEAELDTYYRNHADDFSRAGSLVDFGAVRGDVERLLVAERRKALVEAFLTGLRRRTAFVDLSLPGR